LVNNPSNMKLSIITINLNNAIGLSKTIESVISQSFNDYEFIVIDGGSDDGSIDIIEKYKNRINYWISEPDTGIYNAMNKGIGKAKGEYLYFLNSGDYLASGSVLSDVFDSDYHDSFICTDFFTSEDSGQIKNDIYRNRDWSFSLYDIYSGFLAHQAFFIKKEMFNKYGLYDERLRIMADWKLFFIAIGIHHEKVLYRGVDLVVYDTNGLSSRIGGKVIYEEKKIVAKEELSPDLFKELDRLYFLEKNGFIMDFILSKKWVYSLFRVFFKFCRTFKLTKI